MSHYNSLHYIVHGICCCKQNNIPAPQFGNTQYIPTPQYGYTQHIPTPQFGYTQYIPTPQFGYMQYILSFSLGYTQYKVQYNSNASVRKYAVYVQNSMGRRNLE